MNSTLSSQHGKLAGIVRKNVKIRGNMNPEPNWEHVGSYRAQPVYREKLPKLILVEQKDRNGNIVYVKDPRTGVELRPRFLEAQDPKDPWIENDFVLVDIGNGIVKKNYHFMGPEPQEIGPTREEALEREIAELKEFVMTLAQQQGAMVPETQSEGEEAPEPKAEGPRKQPKKAKAGAAS